MVERTIIETNEAPIMPVPLSQAVAHGSTLYVGGQAGFDAKTRELVSDRFDEQFRQVMRNLEAVVKAGGSDLDQALKVTVYVARIDDYQAMNAIYADFFPHHPPARKVVQCELLPGILCEVDAIVALPDTQNPDRGDQR